MSEQEELPELFRIDYYSIFFIGELISVNDKDVLFSGFIQYFDNHVICTAISKRELLAVAEEMCYMVLSYSLHLGTERTINILRTPYYLN